MQNMLSLIPLLVHRLRPADIKVVAALGDSITVTWFTKKRWEFPEYNVIYQVIVYLSGWTVSLCMQTGFGAKAKNLLQLRNEYRGASWRWEMVEDLNTIHFDHVIHWLFFFLLTSIGGDNTLETVTTLPSKSPSELYGHVMHISTTRWESWSVTKQVFGLL